MGVTPISVPQSLAYVLTAAGDRNGVDFDYLLQTAMRESSLNPEAKAQTSSAVGLFQFLESTWLQVMKEDGPRLGYGDIAANIERSSDGDYVVRDAATKAEILKLREDYRRQKGSEFSLEEFHNRFMQEGFPPLKIVRQALLGDNGPTL